METSSPIAPILAVLFLCSFVKSAFGFGDALIAMPLLALLLDLETATPLVALAASTSGAIITLGSWRRIEYRAGWRLVVSTLVGIPLGLLVLHTAPEVVIKFLLGVLLTCFGLFNLITPKLPELADEKLSYLFGFVAGILGGAYNTNGPPVVIYGLMKRWSPEVFRATLQGYFILTGWTILAAHAVSGFWTSTVLELYLWSLPVLVVGIVLGGVVNKRFTSGPFNRAIYAVLVAMGVLLMLSA